MSGLDDERKHLSVRDLRRLEERKLLQKGEEENWQLEAKDFVAIGIAAIETIFLPIVISILVLVVIGIIFGIITRFLI
ncbi:MAG: hypothetical protein ACXAEU_09775 [Candidatus Hodarchaeales archaeon]|jgi:hypothetical protein